MIWIGLQYVAQQYNAYRIIASNKRDAVKKMKELYNLNKEEYMLFKEA